MIELTLCVAMQCLPPDLRAKLAIPPPPEVDPEEIARGLVPKLETLLSDIRCRLDAVFSGIVDKLDAAAASLRGKFDGVEMKLKTVETSIEHGEQAVPRLHLDAP